jgi:preprotein translocase subunit SecE
MNITQYLKETKSELKHVSWPTRRQAAVFTAVVIIFSLAVAVFLGLLDAVFNFLLKLVV